MINFTITFPLHKHMPPDEFMNEEYDLAFNSFLQGQPIALTGNVTWSTEPPIGLEGFPFKTLRLTAFEHGISGWVFVKDWNIDLITLVDPTTAECQGPNDLTPNDAEVLYGLRIQAIDAATNVLATATPVVLRSAPAS
jgi:hypothetical protein